MTAIHTGPSSAWLEPCVGDGSLLRAVAQVGVPRTSITAIDLEPGPEPSDALADVTRGVDFISWAKTQGRSFDRIVANPPFIALNRLPEGLRREALTVKDPEGRSVPYGGNYWCSFLYQALLLLRQGGSLAFVLPAAWEYADYARTLRQLVVTQFRRFEIHRSRTPLFETVQDGSVVVVGTGFHEEHVETIRYHYRTGTELVAGLAGQKSDRSETVERQLPLNSKATSHRRLDEVMSVTIGAVTGDARYFLLKDSDRIEWRLPRAVLRPALTHARDLRWAEVGSVAWEQLLQANRRVWLFRPSMRMATHRRVAAYLNLSNSDGGCNQTAFKVRDRDPWYLTELPRRPHGFLSGMSRRGPWIALNRVDSMTASNTLYTVRFREQLSLEGRAAWCLSLLTSDVRRRLEPLGRCYPDGLLKYEPKDLHELQLLVPPGVAGARKAYRCAIALLLADQTDEAVKIADNFWDRTTRA